MLVSVGSALERGRSGHTSRASFTAPTCWSTRPDGKFVKVYASGIRNCVGEAINPTTGQLWCSTNERDALGDNLVPDYITSVKEDGFYGWPCYYMGGHQDPRLDGQASGAEGQGDHSGRAAAAALRFAGADVLPDGAASFLRDSSGDGFAAEHGSWNKAKRAGYEVIRIPMKDGHATGEFEDFLTGFVTRDGEVWGRPVGVAVAKDGSLFVTR